MGLIAALGTTMVLAAVVAAAILIPRSTKERQSASPATTGGFSVTVRGFDDRDKCLACGQQ